ncbi:MAG: hypothetical protein GC188_07595 [Alphaproteobacteria bacterium]|nr:hypothetical protein [Alphaproteobacteria bacterium]
MTDTSSTNEIRIDDPSARMIYLRGLAIGYYANIEQSLASLLTYLMRVEHKVGGLIFFSVVNTRSRRRIINKLLNMRLGDAAKPFRRFMDNELNFLDGKRNEIVHWAPVNKISGNHRIGIDKPDSVALSPPNLSESIGNSIEVTDADIVEFVNRCEFLHRAINIFVFLHFQEEPDDASLNTLREKYEQPWSYPPAEGHPLYKPPLTLAGQPQS